MENTCIPLRAACGYRVAEFAVEFGNGGKNI